MAGAMLRDLYIRDLLGLGQPIEVVRAQARERGAPPRAPPGAGANLRLQHKPRREVRRRDAVQLDRATAESDMNELLDAIRAGVHDAVWAMITNATMAPCADFYDAVQEGVAEGDPGGAAKSSMT